MTVRMEGRYSGNKKLELTHLPSGTKISTAAPVDNHGDGSSFSPTDLMCASLGACMLTIIAIVGERDGLDLSKMRFSLEKHMETSPRRVGRIPISIHLPGNLNPETRKKLENAANTCPVHRSLLPEIQVEVSFHYDV